MTSIITPHFDRPALLGEMVASVKAQTCGDWELLIVDDQSSPENWEAIQTLGDDPRIRILRRETPPKGPSHCRNIALREAQGDYVIFLDSDDLLAPWCLEERVTVMKSRPDLDFAVFQVLLFRERPGDWNCLWNRFEGSDDLKRFLRATPPWSMTSPIWRIDSIRTLGGLDERLRYGTDSELNTRALIYGMKYHKSVDLDPDVFVRRDETPRFNSVLSDSLMAAHIDRVVAGSEVLRSVGAPKEWWWLWEVQYFAELEYLIFEGENVSSHATRLIKEWAALPFSSFTLVAMMRVYALVAVSTRKRTYILLRIMRRMVLAFIPRRFISEDDDGGFHSASLDPIRFRDLVDRIGAAYTV